MKGDGQTIARGKTNDTGYLQLFRGKLREGKKEFAVKVKNEAVVIKYVPALLLQYVIAAMRRISLLKSLKR